MPSNLCTETPSSPSPARSRRPLLPLGLLAAAAIFSFLYPAQTQQLQAQEDPLTQPVAPIKTPAPAPQPEAATDSADPSPAATPRHPSPIRLDVNLVLVPATVTDPHDRLVTGLEKENFALFDNNTGQIIKTFSTQDAPITIGIIFDLSGSMSSKFARARKALSEFMRTSNPQDEFFVIGFNDRPAVIVDYTSDIEDVEARMVMMKPENRTALIDAIYLGVDKLKTSRYERRALLVISDGGDNRSRYTQGELRRAVRESDLQIYSIGVFDAYAATVEEQTGPLLLNDISEMTGGRMFRINGMDDLTDVATRISAELRNEYVLGYRPTQVSHDGHWRKVKVNLIPPPGLPPLDVHYRQGYYSAVQ